MDLKTFSTSAHFSTAGDGLRLVIALQMLAWCVYLEKFALRPGVTVHLCSTMICFESLIIRLHIYFHVLFNKEVHLPYLFTFRIKRFDLIRKSNQWITDFSLGMLCRLQSFRKQNQQCHKLIIP
jgi:hypothetical protein